jgi:hypothetical protein
MVGSPALWEKEGNLIDCGAIQYCNVLLLRAARRTVSAYGRIWYRSDQDPCRKEQDRSRLRYGTGGFTVNFGRNGRTPRSTHGRWPSATHHTSTPVDYPIE